MARLPDGHHGCRETGPLESASWLAAFLELIRVELIRFVR